MVRFVRFHGMRSCEALGQTGLDAQKGATILRTAVEQYSSPVRDPKTAIGQSLRGVAQVKLADLGTRVFYTAHSSFDTHATQLAVPRRWCQKGLLEFLSVKTGCASCGEVCGGTTAPGTPLTRPDTQ